MKTIEHSRSNDENGRSSTLAVACEGGILGFRWLKVGLAGLSFACMSNALPGHAALSPSGSTVDLEAAHGRTAGQGGRVLGGSAERGSGLQVTPDGKRTLINKDVGAERWAITRNGDDETVTGNVFFSDGRDPVFIYCRETGASSDELMLSCEAADRCPEAPCPGVAWSPLGDVTLPLSFFEPPAPTPLPTGPLGRRRFSIDPATSFTRAVTGVAAPVENAGFEGWIELEAGEVDPATGLALVSVVDASPVIAIAGITPGVGPTATCIVPQPGQFPIANAGVIDCNGGSDFSYALIVDHNIGVVGVDGFTEQDCASAGGTVEGPDDPHPGVCNGSFTDPPPQLGEDSGAGALIVAPLDLPDPIGPGGAFNVRITNETALPCGDEAVPAFDVAIVLTTARTTTTINDERDLPGAILTNGPDGITGENFDCHAWSAENGPGAVSFTGFALDYELPTFAGFFFDAISAYYFDD